VLYELSPWGFAGLGLGVIGLTVAAGLYTLDEWEDQDDRGREASVDEWIELLGRISDQLEARKRALSGLPASYTAPIVGVRIEPLPERVPRTV